MADNKTVWVYTYFKAGEIQFRVMHPSHLSYGEGEVVPFVVPTGFKQKPLKDGRVFKYASANIASRFGEQAGFSEIPSERFLKLMDSVESWVKEGVKDDGTEYRNIIFDAVCIGDGVIKAGKKDLPAYDKSQVTTDFK